MAKRCSFRDKSGENYLWITVPMMVTIEVPQTATRITEFDFGPIARNQVTLRSSRPAEYRSSSKCAFVRFILFDETNCYLRCKLWSCKRFVQLFNPPYDALSFRSWLERPHLMGDRGFVFQKDTLRSRGISVEAYAV